MQHVGSSHPRAGLAPFLAALWDMVDSDENATLISWSEDGLSFFVNDPDGLEQVLAIAVGSRDRVNR